MHSLATPFSGRRIVLCVAGGIAAYKSVYLLRTLVKAGADVRVAMTPSAREFVGPMTFQALSGQAVFTDLFNSEQDAEIGHIRVADGADLVIVAPATANLIAKVKAGLAHDPVTAAILAARCPILLAPAMNVNMWEAQSTQDNLRILVERGFHFVGPDSGFLACKWTGTGRLAEPDEIALAAAALLTKQDLQGLRVVVSAGGTKEDLDPVRFLGNRSTGKMGHALAAAAMQRGATVHLVSAAPPDSLPPATSEYSSVRSAEEMRVAVTQASAKADLVIMAAAVADYRSAFIAPQKLKKSTGELELKLTRTIDILAELGASRRGTKPFLVGFAAETENRLDAARDKLRRKGCDMIIANDVSQSDRGFSSDNNAVDVVSKSGVRAIALASKDSIAHSILDQVLVDMRRVGKPTLEADDE